MQIQETKDSGWIFDENNSLKIGFYKTGELKSSSYVKNPSRSNAILNLGNIDQYCFLWSKLPYLHPCENSHPSRVKNLLQNFNELNYEGFVFTNGLKCSDVHKFERFNN